MYNDSDSEDDEEKENLECAGADPENLDYILDEFLDKFDVVGRKMVAKPEGASAAENVDVVRRQLGGARLDEDGGDDSDSEEARRARDEEIMAMISEPKRPDWDCQSVLCELAARPSLTPYSFCPDRRLPFYASGRENRARIPAGRLGNSLFVTERYPWRSLFSRTFAMTLLLSDVLQSREPPCHNPRP